MTSFPCSVRSVDFLPYAVFKLTPFEEDTDDTGYTYVCQNSKITQKPGKLLGSKSTRGFPVSCFMKDRPLAPFLSLSNELSLSLEETPPHCATHHPPPPNRSSQFCLGCTPLYCVFVSFSSSKTPQTKMMCTTSHYC